MIINVKNLKKEFEPVILFENVNFQINKGEKVALIGANGSGKTTLIKMILNQSSISEGTVNILNNISIGYLSQFTLANKKTSLINEIKEVFSDIIEIEKKLNEVTQLLTSNPNDQNILNKYGHLEHEFNLKGGYDYHYQIDTILSVFSFKKEDYNRPINSFSGGEKTRLSLAKLLLSKPDLLILDEPTNHLDLKAVEYLEKFIKSYNNTVLIITHDKYFINNVCNKIIELENNTAYEFNGTYENYLLEKTRRYESELSTFKREQAEIRRLQDWVDRNKHKASKVKTAKDREKKISRIKSNQTIKPTKLSKSIGFKIDDIYASDKIMLRVNNLALGYDKVLIDNINFKIAYQDKLAIIGPNGIGKTTLIKILLEDLKPLKGSFRFTKKMKTGYLEQSNYDFNYNHTLFDEIRYLYPNYDDTKIRNLLASFLFYGEDVFKEINLLSGGELVRLALLKLMLEKIELLLLDEPTNHLDLPAKDVIEDQLSNYSGPIIFVSHDRYFINKVATHILDLSDGKAKLYKGNYDDYKAIKEQEDLILKTHIKESINKKNINYSSKAKQLEIKIIELEDIIKVLKDSLYDEEIYSNIATYKEVEKDLINKKEELKVLYEEYDRLLEKI